MLSLQIVLFLVASLSAGILGMAFARMCARFRHKEGTDLQVETVLGGVLSFFGSMMVMFFFLLISEEIGSHLRPFLMMCLYVQFVSLVVPLVGYVTVWCKNVFDWTCGLVDANFE